MDGVIVYVSVPPEVVALLGVAERAPEPLVAPLFVTPPPTTIVQAYVPDGLTLGV
jgi:hypothetical protein